MVGDAVDIIRKASEEHEECMKSLDDVRIQKQPKHMGVGKSSKQKDQTNIPSVTSAFQREPPTVTEDHESLQIPKERGHQQAISMAAKFQNASGNNQQTETTATQQSTNSSMFSTQSVTIRHRTKTVSEKTDKTKGTKCRNNLSEKLGGKVR